eukprot:m.329480 g.329480  ORF g.329480 m.329480 type:complete len:375 (+) comp55602_c0_seq34:71-1195(+)
MRGVLEQALCAEDKRVVLRGGSGHRGALQPDSFFTSPISRPTATPPSPTATSCCGDGRKGERSQDQEESHLTALWDAADDGHLTLIQQLVAEHGRDILTAQEPYTGYTALQFAVWRGHANVLEWLLDQGFGIDAPDKLGWTPLMFAAFKSQTELAKMLLDRGANIAGKFGRSATQLAQGEVRALLEAHKRLRAQQNIKPAARTPSSLPPPPVQAEQDLSRPNLTHLLLEEGEPVPCEDPPLDLPQSLVADEAQPLLQEASSPTTVPMPLGLTDLDLELILDGGEEQDEERLRKSRIRLLMSSALRCKFVDVDLPTDPFQQGLQLATFFVQLAGNCQKSAEQIADVDDNQWRVLLNINDVCSFQAASRRRENEAS